MKNILLALTIVIFYSGVYAQTTLYTPRDIKSAYAKGTRSTDGNPGKNYWQNSADYNISISALPPDRNIKGKETIIYYNNSPDTLNTNVIKLFLNIHKPGAPRGQGASADYLTEGVHIDSFSVNGNPTTWRENPRLFTWATVRLPKPLLPGDSVKFSFDWHYSVSEQSGREGMIDSATYFLAYFYPRVAVYDDYSGWDKMNFTDDHEFYSDFNNYTVSLTVPKNYIVWGTGTIQHPEKLLQPEILKRYNRSFTSDETIHIAGKDDEIANRVTVQNAQNTWTFKAANIPDMAFALSNHFIWDACSVIVNPVTKRRAGAQAAYNDSAVDYHYVAQYAKFSLDWLSHNWPGIAYPYEKTTVVQGFAGMEYPMMANDETYRDTAFSKFVAEHEIAHTYMPFYMGINETRFGFMDEGWATTFEYLIGINNMGKDKADEFYKLFRVNRWIHDNSADEDLPIITPGDALTGSGLGNNEYGKASLGYLAMKDLLGDAVFKDCLHEYMRRWHGKHPLPWDFFYTFNNQSGKNLNWFWKGWFFDNSYIDISIKEVIKTSNGYTVTLDNIGGMPAPANLIVSYADGTAETFHQTPQMWQNNIKQALIPINTSKKINQIKIDGGIWMDADLSNNTFKVNG